MLKGFKEFILRGNVIDLAVAVVIGAAFTALVTAITANLIQPVLNAFGGVEAGGWGFYINPEKPDTFINIGAIVTAIITFLITAAVVYFVFVAPMKKVLAIAAARNAAKKVDGQGRPDRGRTAGPDPRPAADRQRPERRRDDHRHHGQAGQPRLGSAAASERRARSAVVRGPVVPVPAIAIGLR